MSSKLFESNWRTVKEALLSGDDLRRNWDGRPNDTRLKVMQVVLENTMRVSRSGNLYENASAGGTSSGNIATLNKVILPVLRRVMPTVIANEIIGVQPMTGPVAQIHTLRARYADSIGGSTGVVAGAEALSPFQIASFYSGNQNPALPLAAPTSQLEGTPGARLNLQVVRKTVEAKTRKLSARWTLEAAQDAQAQQGLDIEAELMAMLAQEITGEIDQEILGSLIRLAGAPTAIYSQANVSGTATFVGDEHAALATMMNRQANLVSQRTRRGAANWAVVSPTALTILQSATTSVFARTTEGTFEAPSNTKYVGTLNNSMRIYVNQLSQDNTPVLVGLKNSDSDSAAYYCPYVPLTSSGVVMDPNTFEPVVSFATRYGYLELTSTADSFGNSSDYLGVVGIDTTSLKFM